MSQPQQLQSLGHQAALAYLHPDIVNVVPAELQEISQWVTWEAGDMDDAGKFEKLPRGKDMTGKKWQKPQQWYSFSEAIAAAERLRHAGVGIVLPALLADGSHLVALDYDSVDLETSVLINPRLDEIKASHKKLKSPYIEESPSGKGLRLFVRCANSIPQISVPNPLGGKDELFCASSKWVTLTGRKLGGTGVKEATSEINTLADVLSKRIDNKNKPKGAKKTKARGESGGTLSPLMDQIFTGWTGWSEQKLCDNDGRESKMLSYAGYLRAMGHQQADIERLCLEANNEHYEDLLQDDVVLDRARRFTEKKSELDTESEKVTEARPAWVINLNRRFAEVRMGSSVLILDDQTPMETPSGMRFGPGYLDVQAFRQMHNGSYVPREISESKPQSIANAWLSHPARRQYQGAVFSPGKKTPNDILNLWSGYSVEPAAGDVQLWLRVLQHVAPDSETRAYVLQWLAFKIQNPGEVPGTILLVKGGKGSGKNSLFEPVVRIFGAHGRVFDDAEQIAGRFTGHLQTVAFAVLDEALFTGNHQQGDRIKSRVTASSMTFEAKGRDPVQGVNRCAYVSLSNHSHVWQATLDERRAVVVETSDDLINDMSFWKKYHIWLGGDGPAALLYYLQNLDVSSFDCRVIPKGTALREQIEHTALRDPAVAWWNTVLTEGAIPYRNGMRIILADDKTTEVSKSALRESFSEFSSRAQAGDWSRVMRKLKGWVGGLVEVKRGTEGNRQRMVVLSNLSDLRKKFEGAVGVIVAGETYE
jgi:hypothetical protein